MPNQTGIVERVTMIYMLYPVLAGLFLTMQNSFNGLMTPFVGAMGAALATNVIILLMLIFVRMLKTRSPLDIRHVPKVYLTSGLLASIIIGTTGVCVNWMGSAVTACCSVAGQIVMSAVVDHFGLFGTKKNRFTSKRMPGFSLILAGVIVMNVVGGATDGVSLGTLAIAIALGSGAIIVRILNYRITQCLGSSVDGGIVHSGSGVVSALVFFIAVSGFRPDFAAFRRFSTLYYLAGVFGGLTFLCNVAAYQHLDVFYATVFMLIGQIGTGIAMDVLVFHALSAGKCIGIAIVLAGVLTDKLIMRGKAPAQD